MTLLVAVLLFLLVVVGMAAAGMKIWVRPKEAMERVVGGGDANDSVPLHPSLAMHALIAKLGNFIPQSPKDVTVMPGGAYDSATKNWSLSVGVKTKVGGGLELGVFAGIGKGGVGAMPAGDVFKAIPPPPTDNNRTTGFVGLGISGHF